MRTKQAVRKNFEEQAAYFAQSVSGMTVADHGSFLLVDSGLPSDTYNVIVARDLSIPDQLLHDGVGYFMAKRWPVALWYWEDSADRLGREALLAYGLTHNETDVAMVADLTQANFNAVMPEGFMIQPAASAREIQQFGAILAPPSDHNSAEERAIAAYFTLISQQTLNHFPAMRHVIGRVQGEAVATGTLFVGSETIGIYNIVTRAEYRHRGFGSAMFAHLLSAARAYPHRYAVLQASADGLRIYQKAGFTAVGEVHVFENRALLG